MKLAIVFLIILLNVAVSKKFHAFEKFEGKQCWGVGTDVLRDFEGDEEACKQKCKDIDCVGFIRVNSGSQYAGKCYFRGEGLQEPEDYSGDDRDCYRTVSYEIHEGQQCWGTGTDILRDFEGSAEDCALLCDTRDDCVGFIRVNSGSQYAGKCYFRGEGLQEPYDYTGDDRDCFEPIQPKLITFVKYEGQQCWGVGTDILRDFEGDEELCKQKCRAMDCVGFVRVNSGSQYAGKCYFRGEGLQDPIDYSGDDRDCYRTVAYEIHEGQQCWGTGTDILRDFEGTAEECGLECDSRDDCVGFIRVNSGSQYAGKCYFRGGGLQEPEDYTADDRDCFVPIDFTSTGSAAIVPGYNGDGSGYNRYGSGYRYNEGQGTDNDYYKIMIDSSSAMMIGGLLIVILIANIGCMACMNCKGKDKRKGWKRMKYAEGGSIGNESEVPCI